MDTITRVVPLTDGISRLTADRNVWNPIEEIVKERFGATLQVHLHTAPGAYHGREFVEVAHFLLELTAQSDQIPEIIDTINPMIEEVIKRNIKKSPVPAES